MNGSITERAGILIQQSRHSEAISLLENHLQQFPEDTLAKYYYISSLLQSGQIERARNALNSFMADEPDSPLIISLAAQVSIAEEKYSDAESFARKLIEMLPFASESHMQMARVKLGQRNYDRALESVNQALSIDPEDVEALNLKTFVEGRLGIAGTNKTLDEALKLDPENPYTIANHGMQLLREGKVSEALERFKYAMSLNPTNELARYGLLEAIKSKFFIYRFFFKYSEWSSRLTGTQMWIFILGTFFGMRLLRNLSKQSPELAVYLTPIVYGLIGLFLLSWIATPIMNLFLLLNHYGRLLLDRTDKLMARYTGMTLLAAFIFLVCYFIFDIKEFLTAALLFTLFMIPLGTFLNITRPSNKRIITMMTWGIIIAGVLGTILNLGGLTGIAFIGIFIYQWVFNGMMIKEHSRTIDI